MGEKFDRFSIPDVQHAVPIEDMVARMRKDIMSECAGLLKRTKTAGASMRARRWESRISRIIETQATTYCISDLKKLKSECRSLSQELESSEKI